MEVGAIRVRIQVASGEAAAALTTAQSTASLASKIDLPEVRARAQHALGKALEANGQTARAAKAYREAVDLLFSVVRRGGAGAAPGRFFDYLDTRLILKDTIELLNRLGRGDEALEILEAGHQALGRGQEAP